MASRSSLPALIALTTVALVDPKRPADKRLSDRADLWRMLTNDPREAPAHVRALGRDAPSRLANWMAEQLEQLLGEEAEDFSYRLRGLPGAPTADEVLDVWQTLIQPHIDPRPT